MNQSRSAALLALLALPALPPSASPQEVTVLTEDLCTSCSIEITPDVLLGADGESVIGSAWDIQRLSDGRFTMVFQNISAWAEFTVFSADGTDFLRVGREGEGPGEYAHVSYRIDRWDPATGELLQTFERAADWFPDGGSAGHSAAPGRPPATGTRAMHLDQSGRLWVYISRPAPDWEDRLERTPPDAHPEWGPWKYGPGSSEAVIEVLDLESGRVLVSQVVDLEGDWGQFFAPGWLAVYDEEVIPQYRMWRISLEGMN